MNPKNKTINLLLSITIVFSGSFFVFIKQTKSQVPSEVWAHSYYRWYVNNDALTPTDPWPKGPIDLGENTAITLDDQPPSPEAVQRLRIALELVDGGPSTDARFKLQYAEGETCSALMAWVDVGTVDSEEVWRGYNNTAAEAIDDGNLPSTLLSISDYPQTYEENNPTATIPQIVQNGEHVEWDFVLQNHNAPFDTPYCFRMVHQDGTPIDFYPFYPFGFTDAPYTPKSQNWRWYGDETNETPSTALAAENTAPTDITAADKLKLRMTVKETLSGPGTDIKMKLQFSTTSDFSSDINNLAETGSCTSSSVFCYADGVDTDDDSITTRVLADSDASGRHNESGTSGSTYDPAANEATEWEWTIIPNGADANVTYYFRAYDVTNNLAVPLNTSETYASLKMGQTMTFTISGISSSTSTEGITTDVTTTATTVPFGTLTVDQETEAAQKLTVTTSAANGYKIKVFERSTFIDGNGDTISDVSGTNASPAAWPTDPDPSAWGYHAGDDSLESGSTRFQSNDTYAKFTTTAEEVVFTAGPGNSDQHDFIYKIEAGPTQPQGSYSVDVVFIATPIF